MFLMTVWRRWRSRRKAASRGVPYVRPLRPPPPMPPPPPRTEPNRVTQ